MKVNLGCGNENLDGYVNVDMMSADHIHHVANLDCETPWRFATLSDVELWRVSHVIEHIRFPLNLLEAMWYASVDGADAFFACPHGSSDDAWEDPTHVRPMFERSWFAFDQRYYWRTDYGYRADWSVEQVELVIDPSLFGDEHVYERCLRHERNDIYEMRAHLKAVKPPRDRVTEPVEMPLKLTISPAGPHTVTER